MSTDVIITLVAVFVVFVIALTVLAGPGRSRLRGGSLKRRFGPEYDRTVARHSGDTKAAERELRVRVREHGGIEPRPLSAEQRGEYTALWAGIQERFVDSPQHAAAEAEQLLARLARDRGYPDGKRYEEQVAALSVHHGACVQGYRTMHAAARGTTGTEELRTALIEGRRLFEELVAARPADKARHRPRREHREHREREPATASTSHRFTERAHAPWAFSSRHESEGDTR